MELDQGANGIFRIYIRATEFITPVRVLYTGIQHASLSREVAKVEFKLGVD